MEKIGRELDLRFLRPLGRGSEGEVWLAEDLARDRLLVAWKRIRGGAATEPEEFRLLRQIRHPSLNEVLDSGALPEGGRWFTSRFLSGLPIDRLPSPLDPLLLEGIIRRAALALAALSEAGFRHGDVKPAHILWSGPDPLRVELIDLGNARPLEDPAPPASGTPPYAAPELWGARPRPTRSSDVYALAISALEVLRGSPVSSARTLEDWRRWHGEGDREAAMEGIRAEVSDGLRDALRSAISPDPADRPRDPAALALRLRAWGGDDERDGAAGVPEPTLVGREEWLRAAQRALTRQDSEAVALICPGAKGVGKSRLLRALADRLRRGQGVVVEEGPEPLNTERVLAALSLDAPRRCLMVDDPSPARLEELGRLWRRLRQLPGSPPVQLVIGLPRAEETHSVVLALEAIARPIGVHPIAGLDRDSFGRLAREVGDPPRELDALWESSGGLPTALLSAEAPTPVPSIAPEDQDPELRACLAALPAPIPATVLARGLSMDGGPDALLERLTAAGIEVGSLLGVTRGGLDDSVVLPLREERAPPDHETLLRLAREWEASGDWVGSWGALVLRARGGHPCDPDIWWARTGEAIEREDAIAALTLARHAPPGDAARWRAIEARLVAGEAEAVRGEIPDHPPTADPDALRVMAIALEATEGAARALPFARSRLAQLPESAAVGERVSARIAAARLAIEAGDGEACEGLLLEPIDPTDLPPRALLELGLVQLRRGELTAAQRALDGAIRAARGAARPGTLLGALSCLSGVARQRGDLLRAAQLIERAIRYARFARLEERNPALALNQGAILHSLRRSDEALVAYRRAARHLAAGSETTLEVHALLGEGTVQRDLGRLFPALIALRRALRRARECRSTPLLSAVLGNLGEIELLLGSPLRSLDHREEQLRLARDAGVGASLRQARLGVAASALRCGALERVDELLAELQEAGGEGGPRLDSWEARVRAERLALEGPSRPALRAAARALRDALRSGRSYMAPAALRILATLVAARGDEPRAHRLLRRGMELARLDPCPALSRVPLVITALRLGDPTTPAGADAEQVAREALRLGLAEDFLVAVSRLGTELPDDLAERAAEIGARLSARYGPDGIALLEARRGEIGVLTRVTPRPAPAPIELATLHPPSFGQTKDGLRPLPAWSSIREACLSALGARGMRACLRTAKAWRTVDTFGDADLSPPPPLPPGREQGTLLEQVEGAWTLWLRGDGRVDIAIAFSGTGSEPSSPLPFDAVTIAAAVELEFVRARGRRSDEKLKELREEIRTLRAREQTRNLDRETQPLTQQLTGRLDSFRHSTSTGSLASAGTGSLSERSPWVTASASLRSLTEQVERWHELPSPILLIGESGVGKSALLERFERGATGPVITENCAALPEGLLEAELFGFVPGAFTGADREHPGLLARAAGGTLILDQLEELSPTLQAKLLRTIDSGTYRPLGSAESHRVELRFIATLREAPALLIERGALRAELYFRLQGIEVTVPPLRERREEIRPLVEAHLQHGARTQGLPLPTLEASIFPRLEEYAWPGNVRELVNLTQRWLIEEDPRIGPEDLGLPPSARLRASEALPTSEADWRTATDRFHRELLARALERHGGNQTKTAKALGLSRRHLQNLLNKLGFRSTDS